MGDVFPFIFGAMENEAKKTILFCVYASCARVPEQPQSQPLISRRGLKLQCDMYVQDLRVKSLRCSPETAVKDCPRTCCRLDQKAALTGG